MHSKTHPLALAATLFIATLPAARASEPEHLGPVQVTASRTEQAAGEVPASVTVLTREDITRAQAPDLVELLARQAGVDIARNGGPGQASTVFLRGGNSNHALVLVDGIRVNAATQGILDFAHLPLAMIERIEIVRGPRAALWGSDAIGGVIQVFTRDPATSFVEARAGSYGRRGIDAGMGVTRGDARLGIALGHDRLAGFSATSPAAGPYSYDPDPDGYSNRHGSLRAQAQLGSQQVSASALVTDADVDFDAGVGPDIGETAATNRVFGARLAGPLGGAWSHELVLGNSSEDLDTPAYLSRFGSRRNSFDWLATRPTAATGALTLGLNWSRESGYSDEGFQGYDVARRNLAAFARWQGGAGAHRFEASLRHDDNSQFGGASTANVGWNWRAAQAWRLRASWGQGFRAPNFNELFYPGFGSGLVLFAGNPALRPERSHTAEAGLDFDPAPGRHLGLSVFRTRVGNLISFEGVRPHDDPDYPDEPDFHAINTRRAAVDGVELEAAFVQGPWRLDGNATWQHARDLDTGADLLRRADRKANLALTRTFGGGVQWGVDVSALSRRAEFGGQMLAGYARVDLRLAAPLAAGWWFDARVENLMDRDYELVRGYLTPGRSGLIGLRWQGQ
jgi:vitamin B12 transporter